LNIIATLNKELAGDRNFSGCQPQEFGRAKQEDRTGLCIKLYFCSKLMQVVTQEEFLTLTGLV
jgi:hypothetical protein